MWVTLDYSIPKTLPILHRPSFSLSEHSQSGRGNPFCFPLQSQSLSCSSVGFSTVGILVLYQFSEVSSSMLLSISSILGAMFPHNLSLGQLKSQWNIPFRGKCMYFHNRQYFCTKYDMYFLPYNICHILFWIYLLRPRRKVVKGWDNWNIVKV